MVEARIDMGSGALFWAHPHSVDLLLFAAGSREITSVQAHLGAVERDGMVIRNDPAVLSATIWFDDGFAGHIGRGFGTDWTISGTLGSIAVLNDGHALCQRESRDDNPYPAPVEMPFEAGNVSQGALAPVEQLAACLRGDAAAQAANAVIRRDIIRGQKVLFAMMQSHLEGGRSVTLDAIDPALVIEARTGQLFA